MKRFFIVAMTALAVVACSKDDDTSIDNGTDNNGNSNGNNNGQEEVVPAPTLPYNVSPTGSSAYTDTELTLTFDSTPTLGTSGAIRIFTSAGTEVDYIDMADGVSTEIEDRAEMTSDTPYNTSMDLLWATPESSKRYRVVYYKAVEVSGKTLTIHPHSCVLDFDTEYYVTIDANAISVTDFDGISEGEWTFRTKAKPSSNTSISVAKTGDADFRTIQGALNFACTASQTAAVEITVANGTYEEQLYMRSKYNVTVKGESQSGVILLASNSNSVSASSGSATTTKPTVGNRIGTIGGRPIMLFESCTGLRFENMTFKNTWSGERTQAEVVYLNNDSGTLAFVNCTLSSRQDTILTKGYNWFYNCTIEGNVDYIWGYAVACLFENCEIRTIKDLTASSNTAYIVQSRTNKSTDPGYVFLNCDITNTIGGSNVYLARSGGDSNRYDNVAYINCNMADSALNEKGWNNSNVPNPSTPSATSGWKYYGVSGVDTSSWVSCYKLSDSEYDQYYKDRTAIFTNAGLSDQSWLTE